MVTFVGGQQYPTIQSLGIKHLLNSVSDVEGVEIHCDAS
jgi:hypothetical protein